MEGLDETLDLSGRRLSRRQSDPAAREWRLVGRWLAFLFGVALLGLSILALGFAAFVIR